jgi:hypothetical protein
MAPVPANGVPDASPPSSVGVSTECHLGMSVATVRVGLGAITSGLKHRSRASGGGGTSAWTSRRKDGTSSVFVRQRSKSAAK